MGKSKLLLEVLVLAGYILGVGFLWVAGRMKSNDHSVWSITQQKRCGLHFRRLSASAMGLGYIARHILRSLAALEARSIVESWSRWRG